MKEISNEHCDRDEIDRDPPGKVGWVSPKNPWSWATHAGEKRLRLLEGSDVCRGNAAQVIEISGARQHNLKNLHVEILQPVPKVVDSGGSAMREKSKSER